LKTIGPAGLAALLCSLAFSFPSSSSWAQETNLAPTPPMGWNSWNHFAERIDDKTVRAQADAMVESGLKDAGYVYINIDDTWEGRRDAQGRIQPNQKFPNMKALADYVHGKGLKLGIYSSPAAWGTKPRTHRPTQNGESTT
jgi:alpha-galactosidase